MQTETINIPKEVQERIRRNASEFSLKEKVNSNSPFTYIGFESGATSEAIKAKGLLDALKEAKQAIEWMNNNMSVDYRGFQEHYGNLFMNTQHKIDDSINNYLNK